MPETTDVLKYFYEEPALMEPVTPDHDPDARRREDRSDLPENVSMSLGELLDTRDAYRGYLAGTNHAEDRVGLTALSTPAAYVDPLMDALGRDWWGRAVEPGGGEVLGEADARRVLRQPARTTVLVTGEEPVEADRMTAVAGTERRRALPALRTLLEDAHVVLFPEPAHDGHDWSLWSAQPMRERLLAAFRAHPVSGLRRFALPYQKARSESKFYFDTWQLPGASPLPDYVEEV